MISTFTYSFGAAALAASWFDAPVLDVAVVSLVAAGANTVIWHTINRFAWRRLKDAKSLAGGQCPSCARVFLEVTSERTVRCMTCEVVYYADDDGLVTRVDPNHEAPDNPEGGPSR